MNDSSHAVVFGWRPACWLRASGSDAFSFLQGQFTNDLRPLTRTGAVYGLWLNLKGKVLADSFVLRGATEEEFWIGSYHSTAAVIRERLESHVIADDVAIEDQTERWAALAVFAPDAQALVSCAVAATGAKSFVYSGRRSREPHVEWVFDAAKISEAQAQFAAARGFRAAEIDQLRIEAAIPSVPADIGPGDLPNEAGLETDAISYTKGCYLGQEVMARLKSMGQVRRRLLRVEGPVATMPSLPAPLFAGARQVGELRTAVTTAAGATIGLAMLSLLHVQAGTSLAFSADGPTQLRLIAIP